MPRLVRPDVIVISPFRKWTVARFLDAATCWKHKSLCCTVDLKRSQILGWPKKIKKNMLVSYFYESLGVTESKSLRRWKVQHMWQSVLYHEQPQKRSDYDDYDFAFQPSVFLVFCQTQHTVTVIITDCFVEVKQTYRRSSGCSHRHPIRTWTVSAGTTRLWRRSRPPHPSRRWLSFKFSGALLYFWTWPSVKRNIWHLTSYTELR